MLKKSLIILFCIITTQAGCIELTKSDALCLEKFFRVLLQDSEGGYVLFNKKPICIHGFNVVDNFYSEGTYHQTHVCLKEGAKSWKKLASRLNSQNIVIHIYDCPDSLVKNCFHILIINKELFLKL